MDRVLKYEEMELSDGRRLHGGEAGLHRSFARSWKETSEPGREGLPYISVPDGTEMDIGGAGPDHVDEIVQTMEADEELMQDNPIAEALRMDQLRCMPQALTMKRFIKAKLSKSVSKKSTRKPLSFAKQARYRLSMTFAKFEMTVKDVLYSYELWYSALKSIEGYFGSSVATYFKFLRLLFICNALVCVPMLGLLVAPQVIHGPDTRVGSCTKSGGPPEPLPPGRSVFFIEDFFTGEGYLTDTVLYYGTYTGSPVGGGYNLPMAYLLTMLCVYALTFIVFSVRMARSYKHSFIETAGGLKNVFANKVFCGWDYSIATEAGARLKAAAIHNELRELLSSRNRHAMKVELPLKRRFWTYGVQVACHLVILVLLAATAWVLWLLLGRYRPGGSVITVSVLVTLLMNLGPFLFTWLVRFEDYASPRTTLYVSLARTFLLEIAVIGVMLTFWLKYAMDHDHQNCWETLFGQEIYRLVVIDFLFSLLFTLVTEVLRHVIYKKLWSRVGMPEFDIARHTLQIIYNQTLFWIGLYFSPLLAVIVTVKFLLTWYMKQWGCMYFCRPSSKSWRAQQTQTVFFVMTFFALLLVVFCIGFVVVKVQPSGTCGPFRHYCRMYEPLSESLDISGGFVHFLLYLSKPGVITGLLIAMGVWTYYLREKSIAQRGMVELLQDMLHTEAKDKEFLLSKISQVTDGKWMYNLKRTFGRSKLYSDPSSTWRYRPTADYSGSSRDLLHQPHFSAAQDSYDYTYDHRSDQHVSYQEEEEEIEPQQLDHSSRPAHDYYRDAREQPWHTGSLSNDALNREQNYYENPYEEIEDRWDMHADKHGAEMWHHNSSGRAEVAPDRRGDRGEPANYVAHRDLMPNY